MPEPIRIVRLIQEEVGQPTMDGTAGSALYRVPFELSGSPSSVWAQAFVEAWDHPTSFTSRHRPGIARVSGRRVSLERTTVEEVESVHKPTLLAAVEEANQAATKHEMRLAREKAEADQKAEEHRKRVADVATKIKFD